MPSKRRTRQRGGSLPYPDAEGQRQFDIFVNNLRLPFQVDNFFENAQNLSFYDRVITDFLDAFASMNEDDHRNIVETLLAYHNLQDNINRLQTLTNEFIALPESSSERMNSLVDSFSERTETLSIRATLFIQASVSQWLQDSENEERLTEQARRHDINMLRHALVSFVERESSFLFNQLLESLIWQIEERRIRRRR